jgi:hypothetical protein
MSIRIRIEQVIDETIGIVTREAHFKNDKQHKDGDQHAVIERDVTTGNVTRESYWKDGVQVPASAKCPVHDMG